jgi:hypothetical protein
MNPLLNLQPPSSVSLAAAPAGTRVSGQGPARAAAASSASALHNLSAATAS